PFDSVAAGDLVVAHLCEPPPLASSRVPELPAVIDEILQRCLQKSPAARFQSMTELARTVSSAERALRDWNPVVTSSDSSERSVPVPAPEREGSTFSGPTTLHDLSGQVSTAVRVLPHRRRSKPRWSAGWIAATVSIVGVVAFLVLRSG